VSALLSFCALDVARTRTLRVPAVAGLTVGVALLASGAALSGSLDAVDEDETVRIAALQGNVAQDEKWSAGRLDRVLDNYEELTRQAAARGAQIVVWPETAFAGLLDLDPIRLEALAELARETRSALVVGAVGSALSENGRVIEHHYDSAFVFAPDGRLLDRYDKTHLVPFGEYLPLRSLIGRFVRAVATGVATGDVSPGERVRAVDIEIQTAAGEVRQLRFGIPICYELLFPDLVRRFSADGGRALLAITNDAWYGRTGAPYQFLAMTAVRAAENGVWTARAANTGVSAIIDSQGRVRSQTRIFERDLLVADVPLRPAPVGGTFYSRHGDVFVGLCGAGIAGLVLAGPLRRVRGKA
jgi:apolipoprotein N-acyltransferase